MGHLRKVANGHLMKTDNGHLRVCSRYTNTCIDGLLKKYKIEGYTDGLFSTCETCRPIGDWGWSFVPWDGSFTAYRWANYPYETARCEWGGAPVDPPDGGMYRHFLRSPVSGKYRHMGGQHGELSIGGIGEARTLLMYLSYDNYWDVHIQCSPWSEESPYTYPWATIWRGVKLGSDPVGVYNRTDGCCTTVTAISVIENG